MARRGGSRILAVLGLVLASLGVVGGASASAAPSAGGYDNTSCTPSPAHPFPVILLHGLGGNGPGNMGVIGTALAARGYCAFDLTYGEPAPPIPVGGLIDIHQSAEQIAAFITQIRAETGAAKVDLVGHSEGAFQSLYLPKVLGLAPEIDRVVALAPPTHGTSIDGLYSLASLFGSASSTTVSQLLTTFGCAACAELGPTGSAVAQLDAGPIAQPGVTYTVIASRTDELVTPHQSSLFGTQETAFIDEPGVTNEYVQDRCPLDIVGHIGLAYDPDVVTMIGNALDPGLATPVTCSFGLPF